ncbi:MAG: PAS domain S-box protein [Candidatus Marinimicrobia bacterium]|nr:PAS domain S-box protein [Candidatus Neomarinimicrobiota bacterium]
MIQDLTSDFTANGHGALPGGSNDGRMGQPPIELPQLLPSPVLEISPEGEIVTYNKCVHRLMETFALQDPAGLLPENFTQLVNQAIVKGRPQEPTDRHIGSRSFRWTFTPGNEPGTVIAYGHEVTEHHQTGKALIETEKRYDRLFTDSPQPMWIYDLESLKFLSVNDAAISHYGFSRSEFEKMTLFDIRTPGEISSMVDRVNQVREGQHVSGKHRHRKKDGTIIDVNLLSHRTEFMGRPAEYVVVIDITEQVKAETELKLAQTSIENARDAAFWSREDQGIVYVNKAAQALTGYSKEELLTMGSCQLDKNMTEGMWPEMWKKLVADGSMESESVIITKSGEEIPVEYVATYLEFDGTGYNFTFVHDLRERKAAKEALQQSQHQLQQSQKLEAIGQLAGGVAHDFNNHLTSIIGFHDLLQLKMDKTSAESSSLNEIGRAANRAKELTRQLLAFSRRQVYTPQVIRINESIVQMQKMLARLIGGNFILKTEMDDTTGLVKIDPVQVEQIVLNLVVNARDAMPEGGKIFIRSAHCTLTESLATQTGNIPPGDYVRLSVTDEGTGIEESVLANIFDPFFTTKNVGMGTGLGLSTIYGIIRQSNGYITVDTTVGKGTEFAIYLPLHVAEQSAEPVDVPSDTAPGYAGGTVLVVDDDRSIVRLLDHVLSDAGYKVLTALDPQEALSVSQNHDGEIDLLLTDVIIPGISGNDLAEKLEADRPQLRTLFMSGHTEKIAANLSDHQKENAFLQKPFTLEELKSKTAELLNMPPA